MLAALASAAMPSIVMAGVRDSERANDTDDAAGIDQAVMQDAAGRMYDIPSRQIPPPVHRCGC